MVPLVLPWPSRSQVDKAGRKLRQYTLSPTPEGLDGYDIEAAFQVLTVWRGRFREPLQRTNMGLRSAVRTACPGVEVKVKQRLKREEQIRAKLARMKIRLTQIEDIAGCRAILPGLDQVRAVQAQLEKPSNRLEVHSVDDYVTNPQRSGYRAVHLHARRDGVEVEVQLRTDLQHSWADTVEDWDQTFGWDVKHGDAHPEALEFFRAYAEQFAHLDQRHEVPSGVYDRLTRAQERLLDRVRREEAV